MSQTGSLTIGTRKSQLARWQTDFVIHQLQSAWPGLDCAIRTFTTTGDRTLDKPLPAIGGKGLFTAELEEALHSGEIDLAVHSLKDLPVDDPSGLTTGAILGRADVHDVLVARNGATLDTLPTGALVGSGSLRRQAQLLYLRPDLKVRSIRGNVETRIKKVKNGDYEATILAAAGMNRLGLSAHGSYIFNLREMLPAPGQGALAVQCRAGDERTLALLEAIDNRAVRDQVHAERAFLQALGGGCAVPVAAFASDRSGRLHLQGLVAAPDGTLKIRVQGAGQDPQELGQRLAAEAIERGAAVILDVIKPLRGRRIVVTRSGNQAQSLAQRLSALGATPILFPAIRVVPLPAEPLQQALAAEQGFDWLVFTSVNAARFFFKIFDSIPNKPPLPKIAAVGSATAAFLRDRGQAVDFMPEKFTGVDLAAGLGDLTGKRVLLPRARIGRPEIVKLLQENGGVVADISLYDTVQAKPTAAALAELERGVDALTFTSPSSVRNFFAITTKKNVDIWAGGEEITLACIGPSTAAELEKAGYEADLIPEAYTIGGLISELTKYYSTKKRAGGSK